MFEDFKNAFQRPNNAHAQLILVNVGIFIVLAIFYVFSQIFGAEGFFQIVYDQFTIPPVITDFLKRPWTLITYAFAHSMGDIFHILFNMLVLYWFGRIFIEYLGSDKLIALYMLGALAGAVLYLLFFNTIPFFIERSQFSGMVGASAAVYAIVVGTATLMPNYTFYLLFFGPVRIKYIAGFYIIISFLGSVGGNAGGNIAHLGGALMGFVYIKQLQAGINWGSWITSTLDWMKGLTESKQNVKVSYRKDTSRTSTPRESKASQSEIDTILDKISEKGYESLTKDEKEKLFNASKK